MTTIDLTDRIDEIVSRYPEYLKSAVPELRALWGGAECSNCGVFELAEDIRVNLDAQKSWYGEVRLAVAPNGWHAIGITWWYGQGGGGSPPSVWNRLAYTTRDEAIAAGINELIARFEGVRDMKGWAPQNQSALAGQMIKTLKDYLPQTRQLILF